MSLRLRQECCLRHELPGIQGVNALLGVETTPGRDLLVGVDMLANKGFRSTRDLGDLWEVASLL